MSDSKEAKENATKYKAGDVIIDGSGHPMVVISCEDAENSKYFDHVVFRTMILFDANIYILQMRASSKIF